MAQNLSHVCCCYSMILFKHLGLSLIVVLLFLLCNFAVSLCVTSPQVCIICFSIFGSLLKINIVFPTSYFTCFTLNRCRKHNTLKLLQKHCIKLISVKKNNNSLPKLTTNHKINETYQKIFHLIWPIEMQFNTKF